MASVAKKLSFNDISLHTPDVANKTNLLNAMREPSEDNFRRALAEVNGSVERFGRMREVAAEQAGTYSQIDLMRTKQDLTALKFSIIEQDVKARFLQAITNGEELPDCGDDPRTNQENDQRSDQLKRKKAENEQVRGEIGSLGQAIAHRLEEYGEKMQEVERMLEETRAAQAGSQAAAASTAAAQAAQAKQAEAEAEVSHLESTGAALDAQLHTSQALLQALQKELSHLEHDSQQSQVKEACLRSEVEEAKAAGERSIKQAETAERRSRQLGALLSTLGGVAVEAIHPNQLQLRITTPQISGESTEHNVTVFLSQSEQIASQDPMDLEDEVGLRIESMELDPVVPGLEPQQLQVLVESHQGMSLWGAQGAARGVVPCLERVLREVRARVVKAVTSQ